MKAIDPISESASDETLRRCFVRDGDQRAFRQLVARHSGMVWRTALRHCGDGTEAEEVAQDTFIVLARKAPALRVEDGLGPWLHRVTVLLSRKAASRRAGANRRWELLSDSTSRALPAPGTGEGEGRLARLDEALAGLPPRERRILWWRYADGLSLREIADRLDSTEAACQKRSERALARLRGRMAGTAAVVAGITESLASLRPGATAPPQAREWAKHALVAEALPTGWKTGQWLANPRSGRAKAKWFAVLGLGTLCGLTLLVVWPRSGESRGTRRGFSTRPVSPAGQSMQNRPGFQKPEPSGMPVEAALREEWLRRRAVRKELHLTLLAERLGLTAEQRDTVAGLYEQHGVNLRTMLGRQAELVVEVSTSRDDLTRGSLGPLSGFSTAFETALASVLSPSQTEAWTAFREELARNALALRFEAYCGAWLCGASRQYDDSEAARKAFHELAAFDIEHRAGIRRENQFHSPPYFEFQPVLTEGILTGKALGLYQLSCGALEYANLPATFRAHSLYSSKMAESYDQWTASVRDATPSPEGRAALELGGLRAAVFLSSEQAELAEAILRESAAAQPVEDWPMFHPASDEEAARRRSAFADSLSSVLTPLQKKVLEDAPLSLPHIGESASLSSRYDAAAW